MKFSFYQNIKDTNKTDIDLENYIEIIKNGKYQDLVLNARAVKKDITKYKELKNLMPCITGSAVMNQGSKNASNILELNGLIVIDIDDDVDLQLLNKINYDKYTFVSHRSFGGDGLCVFIKINSNKFLESFNEIGQYYWDTFNIMIDQSCKNKNRLRFLSYDPYIFTNDKAIKFIAKTKIKAIEKKDFIFVQDDFSQIIDKLKGIDICQDDYKIYCDIGFAIGSKFGDAGLNYFKAICQNGSKYNEKDIEKHYKNFCKGGQIGIGTFYHYVKAEGIEVYSELTKKTIATVAMQKTQGTPTIESVKKHVTEVLKLDAPSENLILDLINSKIDLQVESEETEVNQLKNFIHENYNPYRDSITSEIFINNKILDDIKLNSIYFSAKNCLDFAVNKSDVRDMINSEATQTINPLNEFFGNKEFETGNIEKYADCIFPQSEYNRWAFKKWIIGSIHNWISPHHETKVSPLTLVLCGQKQGTGKTSFFRNLLPKDLKKYLIEHRIDAKDKDSIYNLVKGLLVLDDEFGGLATKDVKDFKKIADANQIDIRLPYSAFYSKMKRKASLCGTSNERDILKDVTGNRRILPINVHSIDYNEMIKINTDDLWREAFDLYRKDFDWKIYASDDIDYLELHTKSNIEILPIEEIFFNHYSLEESDKHKEEIILNQGNILSYLNAVNSINITKYDIKDIFTKNKMVYKSHKRDGKVVFGVLLYKSYDNQHISQIEVPF
ncbi:MAG: PriCT-2 domain-containing protein [Flavobacterium sp.]|nr:PriCT-2 domain-containing protein [Flavobacterium sp.]